MTIAEHPLMMRTRGFSLIELMLAMTILSVGFIGASLALQNTMLGIVELERHSVNASERQKAYLFVREELLQSVTPTDGSRHIKIESDPASGKFTSGPLINQPLNNVLRFQLVKGRNGKGLPQVYPPQPSEAQDNYITYRIRPAIAGQRPAQIVREVSLDGDKDLTETFSDQAIETKYRYGTESITETIKVSDEETLVLCNYASYIRFTFAGGTVYIDLLTEVDKDADATATTHFPLAVRPRNGDF